MINTLRIFDELTETMDVAAAKKIAEVIGLVYEDLQNTATKDDMQEVRDIVSDLAVAQQRTEQRVEELAQAQQRTEQRVEELAQAQQRTEQRVEELAQAQKQTEKVVQELVKGQKDLRRQVGGLSGTIGYTLENTAYKALHSY
jgi:DNA repair ATPase RecN